MIEIITETGTSLDLDPQGVFEIEIEQPMLDDTHIPVPYSTSISFLPTAKNKKTFGYLEAMMLEPTERRISVSIFVGGIRLFYGVLEYESVEDRKINYTFAGRNLEDDYKGYIHKVQHLTHEEFKYNNASLQLLNNKILSTRKTEPDEFGTPMLVGEENITDVEYANNSLGKDAVEINVKYHNWLYEGIKTVFTPAVLVRTILREALRGVVISDSIKEIYDSLAILGMHKSRQLFALYGIQYENGMFYFDIADTLPECTILNLITNISKMFCASIFRDGAQYIFMPNREVMEDSPILDWTDKVGDSFSSSTESAASYAFGYANDDDENTYHTSGEGDGTAATEENSIREVGSMYNVLFTAGHSNDYIAIRNTVTGDMFSGKRMSVTIGNMSCHLPFMDMLLHKLYKTEQDEEYENSFDNSVEFKCVRCIPVKIQNPSVPGNSQQSVCPIVKFPACDEERPSEVWIGTLANNQLVDKGIVFQRPDLEHSYTTDVDTGKSIAPDILYEKFHKPFAKWLSHDRQVITADVKLSLLDIANLRMYHRVAFCNRVFLIKKVSLSFSVMTDAVETSIDFIEC